MIIVTTHNGLPLTKACMKTLLAQNGSPPILAIDNASTDGTYRWLKTQPVDSMYGHYGSVSEMWNTALRYAWSQGFERALVVNNDTELGPETYEYLATSTSMEEHYANHYLFATCVSVSVPEQNIHPALEWSYHIRPHPDFSCFMIHKKCTEIVGWFDENYRLAYGEDCDYHVRMHRAGVEAVCLDIPFLHHGASTIKGAPTEEQERIQRQAERNRQRFFDTYGAHIGVPEEYETLFTPETFGINRAVSADRA